jgi:hypothetical protein
MKKALLCLVIFGLTAIVRAPADTKVFLDSDMNGTGDKDITVIEWYITPRQLEKLPSFRPIDEEPPLSLKAALAVAVSDLKKHLVPQETWELVSIELNQIDAGNSGETSQSGYACKPTGKWFYKVTFSKQRPDPKTTVWTEPYRVYVLMDGTIAQMRERPQTKEEQDEQGEMVRSLKNAVPKDAAPSK